MIKIPVCLLLLFAAGLATSACKTQETAIEHAERRAETIKKFGTPEELCQAKKEVTEAYLEAGKDEEYLHARVYEQSACLDAQR